jgi:hypothetical protein
LIGIEASIVFVREILDMPECDKYYDLSGLRESYRRKLIAIGDNETRSRILKARKTCKEDEDAGKQVFAHYRYWTRKSLFWTLTI